jgi:hypothetical protein
MIDMSKKRLFARGKAHPRYMAVLLSPPFAVLMGSSDLRSFLPYLMSFPPLWARIGAAAVVALGFNIGSPASI